MIDESLAPALKKAALIDAAAAAAFLFFDWRVSAGILLGLTGITVYGWLLSASLGKMLEKGRYSRFGFSLGFLFRLGTIAAPMLIAALYPQLFNIFGAFFGELAFKIALVIFEGIGKAK